MAWTQLKLSGARDDGRGNSIIVLSGTCTDRDSDPPTRGANVTSYAGSADQPATFPTTGLTSYECIEVSIRPHSALKDKFSVRAIFLAERKYGY